MELDIEQRESAAGDTPSPGADDDAERAGEAADETAAAPPREEIAALDTDRQ